MKITKILTCCLYTLGVIVLLAFNRGGEARKGAPEQPNTNAQDICTIPPNSLPSQIGPDAYEKLLYNYVTPPPCITNPNGAECNKCYSDLDAPNCKPCYRKNPGWKADSQIRDTGPFISDATYGTHKAVRVYYSPEIWKWLNTGRKEDDIPDGAMIIKEMYSAPAPIGGQKGSFRGLAIMVRDRKGAWDGWFWSDGAQTIDYTSYPNAGFGLYCLNCHASAKTNVTFAALRNITGDPITFNATMLPNQITVPVATGRRGMLESSGIAPRMKMTQERDSGVHGRRALGGSLQQIAKVPSAAVAIRESADPSPTPKQLVGQWYDHVTQPPPSKDQKMFLTSTQCIGCHDATQNNDSMPNMIYPQIYTKGSDQTTLNLNVSPYSELRSSMMGLSGRDPVFYAQLETEIKLHPEIKDEIINTCMSCHGVMGQRQIELDKKGPFRLEYLDLTYPNPQNPKPTDAYWQYGALARDGVSCTVCHHVSAEGLGTPATYTGKFKTGKVNEIFGPFEEVVTKPMENSLGLTPLRTKEDQIRNSNLCGSCHTVILPVLNVGQKYPPNVFNDPKQRTGHEQETYWEWRNSKYQNEKPPINQATKQSCQDCHMPAQYPSKTGNPLLFKMASIEEDIFPAADFRVPDEDIHLQVRGRDRNNPYSRHTLLGMNIFVLEMFNQFSGPLGITTNDPMAPYGTVPGLILGKKSALDLAQNETAQIEISSLRRTAKGLDAQVKVTNLAGHKFPSGVSFRRAFIEFRVMDANGKTLWVSGDTNTKGVILGPDSTGKVGPLVTEFFDKESNPQQLYQPHYDTSPRGTIDSQAEVQIYEELVKDSDGNFTTSFLSLANSVKDNRIMPQGWREGGPNWEDTIPHGVDKATSPSYFDQSGTSLVAYRVTLPAGIGPRQPLTVTATIYYQTIPPYYQRQRFSFTPDMPFTRSLKYYVDNLNTNKMYPDYKYLLPEPPIKNWKLKIVGTSKKV